MTTTSSRAVIDAGRDQIPVQTVERRQQGLGRRRTAEHRQQCNAGRQRPDGGPHGRRDSPDSIEPVRHGMAFRVIVLFARVRWCAFPELSCGGSSAFFVALAIPPRDYRAGGLGFLNTQPRRIRLPVTRPTCCSNRFDFFQVPDSIISCPIGFIRTLVLVLSLEIKRAAHDEDGRQRSAVVCATGRRVAGRFASIQGHRAAVSSCNGAVRSVEVPAAIERERIFLVGSSGIVLTATSDPL